MDIFSPTSLGDIDLANRVAMAPLTRMRSGDSGVPNDLNVEHYAQRAGLGLIVTEGTYPRWESQAFVGQPGIVTDEQQAGWARVAEAVHARGGKIVMQVMHGGRVTHPAVNGGRRVEAPSAVAIDGSSHTPDGNQPYPVPHALTVAEAHEVRDDFVAASRRAIEAGLDGVEVHGANGYLLHEFLSPLTNLRDDQYGGDLAGRARLLLEIVKAVRGAVGESVPLLVRFSATDWAEGGWDQEQTATVAGWARDAGADMFDISTGGLVGGVTIPVAPGYQVDFASFVGAEADVVVSAVGLITEAQHAAQIVSSGAADVVMLGREFLRDPHFPLRAAHELGVSIDYFPAQYIRAGYR